MEVIVNDESSSFLKLGDINKQSNIKVKIKIINFMTNVYFISYKSS